jgi:hypothetical protein
MFFNIIQIFSPSKRMGPIIFYCCIYCKCELYHQFISKYTANPLTRTGRAKPRRCGAARRAEADYPEVEVGSASGRRITSPSST